MGKLIDLGLWTLVLYAVGFVLLFAAVIAGPPLFLCWLWNSVLVEDLWRDGPHLALWKIWALWIGACLIFGLLRGNVTGGR